MDYSKRERERKFLAMNQAFKAVMVTGARQVGKSTMLKKLAESEERTYVNLDNSRDRDLAKSDPGLFFQVYKPPILIDEAQKAPELFEHIKILCIVFQQVLLAFLQMLLNNLLTFSLWLLLFLY